MSGEDRSSDFFRVIGSRVRLLMLESLRSGGLGYYELMERCGLDPKTDAGTLSFHVKKLIISGLVELRPRDIHGGEYILTRKGECVSWRIGEMKRVCLTDFDG